MQDIIKEKLHISWKLLAIIVLTIVMGAIIGYTGFVLHKGKFSLTDQLAYYRYDTSGGFGQFSVFMPSSANFVRENVDYTRYQLVNSLKENRIEEDTYEGRLYLDAYYGESELTVELDTGKSAKVKAKGVGGDYFYFHPLELVSGTYFTEDFLNDDYVLIDRECAWALFGATDVEGFWVNINGELYVIAGVYNRPDDELNKIAEELDEEDVEKIKNFKAHFKEKYSNNPSVEKKVEDMKSGFFQNFKQSFESSVDIDPGRLLGLTDGIFGMVMTLLVFGLALPEVMLVTDGQFLAFLESIALNFGLTVVAFILVGSFWIYHHEFIKVNSLNLPYLWINIFYLACISFIPFSSSLMGIYSRFLFADMLFGINIFVTIIFFLIMYQYAYSKGFLENNPSKTEKRYVFKTFSYIMILTIAVTILNYNFSEDFMYLFLFVPVISTLRDINFKMNS